MIKLKKLINESAWDRKFGEPLPTLSGVMEKHGGCECEGHGDCGCAVNEDVKDVVKAKQILQKIMNAEGKLRKHMHKLSDRLQADPVNHKHMKKLKDSYKNNVTNFMRDVVGIVNKMK
tara:strand:- start:63 stop:416 length:354 start_codon:yes stop_codon:yes gene_type:complete